jgi:hypothetical protein
MKLVLEYLSPSDLACHLAEHATHGALLVTFDRPAPVVAQFTRVPVEILAGAGGVETAAEVLQVFADGRWVVRLADPDVALPLIAGAPATGSPVPPAALCVEDVVRAAPLAEPPGGAAGSEDLVEGDDAAAGPDPRAFDDLLAAAPEEGGPIGSEPAGRASRGAAGWSIEKLQAAWDSLPLAEKVRVARHGSRAARIHVLKGLDRTLHAHVLSNPRITPEEVAMMAAMPQLDPAVLKRISTTAEWLRHTLIVRNLVTNPKLPLPLVLPLLRHLPLDELRRLGRTGHVRASLKQEIIKRIDRG